MLSRCLTEDGNASLSERYQKYYDLRGARTKKMVELAWYMGMLCCNS